MGKSCDDAGDERVGPVDTGTKDIGTREGTSTPRYYLPFCLSFAACKREFDRPHKLVSCLLPSVVGMYISSMYVLRPLSRVHEDMIQQMRYVRYA